MRRVLLVAVVLLVGAWTCQAPTGDTGGSGVPDVTTTELVELLTGEDWHYVGEAGEPAFGDGWSNAAADRNLAFRIREAGVVDIQGYIQNDDTPAPPTGATLFTLPEGYRPSADTHQVTVIVRTDAPADGSIAVPLKVTSAGVVFLEDIDDDPVFNSVFAGAYSGTALYVTIPTGAIFLNPADAP